MSAETLRSWVKQDRIDRGHGEPGELTTAEREQLRELRREVRVLREARRSSRRRGFLRFNAILIRRGAVRPFLRCRRPS